MLIGQVKLAVGFCDGMHRRRFLLSGKGYRIEQSSNGQNMIGQTCLRLALTIGLISQVCGSGVVARKVKRVTVKRGLETNIKQNKRETETQQRDVEITLVAQVGHTSDIQLVAMSADGKFVVTSGQDNSARLWETETGRLLRVFAGHSGGISAVAISADGKRVVTGSSDLTARLWNAESGKEITRFTGHSMTVISVAISANGKYVMTGSYEDTVRVWEAESGREVRKYTGHSASRIAISPDGNFVVTGEDTTARLCDVQSAREVRQFTTPIWITSVAMTPDAKYVVTGSYDGTARLWDAKNGRELSRFIGHSKDITSVGISADAKYVVTGSSDESARVWEAKSGKEVRKFTGHSMAVTSVAISTDGKYVVTGSWDNTARLWGVDSGGDGEELKRLEGHSATINSVAISTSGKHLVTGSGKIATLWDLENGRQERRFIGHSGVINSVAISTDARYVVTGSEDKTARLWDAQSGREIRLFKGQDDPVMSVAISSNGKYIVTGAHEINARMWDLNSGRQLREFQVQHSDCLTLGCSYVSSVAISPDGKYIATGGGENRVRVWRADNGRQIRELKVAGNYVRSLVFTKDGKYVVIGSEGEHARLWDFANSRLARRFVGTSDSTVSISPDGKHFVTGGDDNIATMWNIETGKVMKRFIGHSLPLTSVTISSDAKYVITGSLDSSTGVWDAATGQELAKLISFTDGNWAVVAPDGRFDVSSLEESKGLHWIASSDPMTPLPLEIFTRDYYEPRLLQRILRDEKFQMLPSLAELNRLQPRMGAITVLPQASNPEIVNVKVEVSSVAAQCLKDNKHVPCESGVYDLRLYRDGQLVKQSPVPDSTLSNLSGPNWRQQVQKWRQASLTKDENGQPITVASGPQEIRFTNIQLPRRSGVSQVEFTAYAFNEDRVKSATSEPVVYSLKQPQSGVQPKAYVVTVGVDFTSAGWRLAFARKGAVEIETLLQNSLKSKYEVVPVQLLSAYRKDSDELVNLATRKNIQTVLNILSGREVASVDREKIPHQEQLKLATPDDLVILYIASHGYADPVGKFYVIPSDIGLPLGVSEQSLDRCLKNSEQSSICEAGRKLLDQSISSDELTQWIEAIDAGQMALILDSCHSGAVTGPTFKPGPMGDRSFGQLSYDKGMLVLAATQRDQVDTGTLELGNRSLLTYALTQRASGPILDLRKWLSDAEKEVPNLYQQFVKESDTSATYKTDANQQPTLFDFAKTHISKN